MHCGAGSFLHTVRKMKKPVALRYRLRITPTSVGNTNTGLLAMRVIKVHPYMCREYTLRELITMPPAGPPLHMQGIQ